jgi:hypothetical protein
MAGLHESGYVGSEVLLIIKELCRWKCFTFYKIIQAYQYIDLYPKQHIPTSEIILIHV